MYGMRLSLQYCLKLGKAITSSQAVADACITGNESNLPQNFQRAFKISDEVLSILNAY